MAIRTPVGRRSFTHAEIEKLRRLIREKQTADRSRQKTLRARMRRMDFYISDFAPDSEGFVVSDLDDQPRRHYDQRRVYGACGASRPGVTELGGSSEYHAEFESRSSHT